MNRGRPLEFDPDTALEAAMQLFWSRGFEATSLQDLLDSMGIARSSFYQAFGSKQEVFLQAVERYRDYLVGELRASMESADSGLAFIEGTLKSVAEDTKCADGRRGCLVFNSAAEFGQKDPEVAGRVAASIDAFTRVFTDAVRRAQEEGDVAPERDPKLLGRHVVCSMSGLRTLAKAGARRKELVAIAELAMRSLG
ncbi:MAG TPA: TetR/AcrR family transcriptional regulator [Woeseiaceae bacterium]|nr:TetR/AcrR family transcriptional regulator [Woeseiaceae bacterium]